MDPSPPIYVTRVATEVEVKERGIMIPMILDFFLAIQENNLVAKIDLEHKKEWAVFLPIDNLEDMVEVLTTMEEEYSAGKSYKTYEVKNRVLQLLKEKSNVNIRSH